MKKSILSLLLVLTMVVSTFAALPMTASADTSYPSGTLLYESFTGLQDSGKTFPTSQPQATEATISGGVTAETDTGAGLGTYSAIKTNKSWTATFSPSYNGNYTDDTTTIDKVASQGPNAKLTLEFDFKGTATDDATFRIAMGPDDTATGSSSGRDASVVSIYFTYPDKVIVYTNKNDYNECALPEGISFDQWHRYQLTLNLTDENSSGLTTFTFKVDGENLLYQGAEMETHTTIGNGKDINKFVLNNYISSKVDGQTNKSNLDNVSVYKTTESNPALSTGALMTKLHEVNAKLAGYQSAAAGTEVLTNLEAAVTAAGTMVTTAFGTYDANGAEVTAATTQAYVDTALANLTNAQEALEAHLAGITYPGGVLVYESFTGIVDFAEKIDYPVPSYQPKDTAATIYRKKAGTDIGAGLGDYAMQHKDNSTTNFTATIPTAYLGEHTDTSVVAAQGPDAQLTLEFDFKFDGEVPTELSTLTAVLLGNSSLAGTDSAARGNSAVAIYLQSPNKVRVFSSTSNSDNDVYYLPEGITFDQWHRYQLAVDLTDATSEGASTYTFTVDGKNIFDAEVDGNEVTSFTKKLSATEITNLRIDTTNAYATRLDNVSVYKTTADNPALSTGALMTKLHEVNAKMAVYSAAAAGKSQLTAYETAVAAAGTMVTTAYGTYDANGAVVNSAKTQADVDQVLASLISAEASLKAVLPYYVISGHEIDENDKITAVTVEEIKAYTGSPVKLIVATFDTAGLSEVSMQDFTGAGVQTLTTQLMLK